MTYQVTCNDCEYQDTFAKRESAERAEYQHHGQTGHEVDVGPMRSEPADFGGGESTGVQDL